MATFAEVEEALHSYQLQLKELTTQGANPRLVWSDFINIIAAASSRIVFVATSEGIPAAKAQGYEPFVDTPENRVLLDAFFNYVGLVYETMSTVIHLAVTVELFW
jgi:hypothetical protein